MVFDKRVIDQFDEDEENDIGNVYTCPYGYRVCDDGDD